MPSQRLLLDAADLFAALGGSVSVEGPTGTVSHAALEGLLQEFSLGLDNLDLGPESTVLSFDELVELLRRIQSSASQAHPSHPPGPGRHSIFASHSHRRSTGWRRATTTTHRVGFPAIRNSHRSTIQDDGAGSEPDSKPPTPSEAADGDSLLGTSPSSLLLTPRSDNDAEVPTQTTGSNPRADLPAAGTQKAVSSVFSQKLDHGIGRSRLDRRITAAKGHFLLVEDPAEDPGDFMSDAPRSSTLGPMAALAAQISAFSVELPSATERSPILLRAEALGGIGTTRFTPSAKPDATAMAELFPSRRKYAPYTLREVEDILHSIDSASRPMHKRAQRTPHSSVAFSGRTALPRLGVMALEELALAKPPASPLKPNLLPRIALLERRPQLELTVAPKRMPQVGRQHSRLPQLSDQYRHKVAATPLNALAQQPSFLAPLRERLQQRELFASLLNPASAEFRQATGPPPGQRFHCVELPVIAANVLSILETRQAIH